jgi:tRNA(Arg) A34 adenosine deaminase TadA
VLGLLSRSVCAVQVAAVLVDRKGAFGWGWNHSGADGLGEHAECHCIDRSNPHRLARAIMYIAARRKKNHRLVTARPCYQCQRAIWGVGRIVYRDENGGWVDYLVQQ